MVHQSIRILQIDAGPISEPDELPIRSNRINSGHRRILISQRCERRCAIAVHDQHHVNQEHQLIV